jgi:hypothetical protein
MVPNQDTYVIQKRVGYFLPEANRGGLSRVFTSSKEHNWHYATEKGKKLRGRTVWAPVKKSRIRAVIDRQNYDNISQMYRIIVPRYLRNLSLAAKLSFCLCKGSAKGSSPGNCPQHITVTATFGNIMTGLNEA